MSRKFARKTADRIARGCAVNALRKVERAVTQIYDEILRPSGLRATQVILLTAIRLNEPIGVKKLAAASFMDRTTLTRNLKPLEREGLVRVTAGADRRVREVSLTDEGHRQLAEAYPYWEEAQSKLRKHLGAGPMRQMVSDLTGTATTLKRAPG